MRCGSAHASGVLVGLLLVGCGATNVDVTRIGIGVQTPLCPEPEAWASGYYVELSTVEVSSTATASTLCGECFRGNLNCRRRTHCLPLSEPHALDLAVLRQDLSGVRFKDVDPAMLMCLRVLVFSELLPVGQCEPPGSTSLCAHTTGAALDEAGSEVVLQARCPAESELVGDLRTCLGEPRGPTGS